MASTPLSQQQDSSFNLIRLFYLDTHNLVSSVLGLLLAFLTDNLLSPNLNIDFLLLS